MKIKKYLLTEQDIENVKLKEIIDSDIQTKVDIQIDTITKEEYAKHNANIHQLDISNSKERALIYIYKSYDSCKTSIAMAIIFIAAIILAILNNITNSLGYDKFPLMPVILFGSASILALVYGIKGLLVKHKIKNNFIQVGIDISELI